MKKKLTTQKGGLEKKRLQERDLRQRVSKIKKDLEATKRETVIYDENLRKNKERLDKKREDLEEGKL